MVELSYRDWMIILGALLILAVLLDALRRVYQERRAPVKIKIARSGSDDGEPRSRDIDLAWLRELPNGGARVIDRSECPEGAPTRESLSTTTAAAGRKPDTAARTPDPAVSAKPPGKAAVPSPNRQPQAPAAPPPSPPEPPAEPLAQPSAGPSAQPSAGPSAYPQHEDELELIAGMRGTDEPENLDWLDALEAEQKRVKSTRRESTPRPSGRVPGDVEPEVFMLNVVARQPGGFRGEDILHILLACDLRFGDMNFFHRHEHEAGRGPIQFSVANMMQPGVFDIDNMVDFTTPGLVFFLTLPGPEDMIKAYDYMLETAQVVARNLGGDVLDETRSVLTRQTLEHARQQIRDLERRLLAKAR